MNRTMKGWSLSIKWSLAYSLLILLVTGALTIGLYLQLRAVQRQALQDRLNDIVSFAAPLVDGDFHSLILSPEDEDSSFYRVISLRLKSIRDTSEVIERIYTLRQQEDGRITFVVDVDPDTPAHVGQDYLRPSSLLEKGLTLISGPVVEDNLYTDSSGTFLSGYAPIYNQFRDLDGVLGIDIDATAIIANEAQSLQTALMAFLGTVPLSVFLGWWLVRRLTFPVNDLMSGVERIAQGHLDEVVPVRSRDELGTLAHTFNYMTTQLRQTLEGLEQEIIEHKQAEKIKDAIYGIAQAAISTDSLAELFNSIHSTLGELISVENFYIALYDPSSDLIRFPYYQDQYDEQPLPVKPGRGLTDFVLQTGESLLVTPEVFSELIQRGDVELIGTKPVDWLGTPLKIDDQIIGVMVVQSYSEEIRFNQENLNLLEFVSTQTALVIERKRVEEALHKSNTRYRVLFEDSPISLWEEDFSSVNQILEDLRLDGVTDFRTYLASHPEVVTECAEQIKILDINKATLALFGAKTKKELMNNLASIFCDESYEAFQDELIYIAEGQMAFNWEGINQTLDGKLIEVGIGWSVVPGYENDLAKVIISMIDITDQKRVEKKLIYLSTHDGLTDLHNRAYFDEEMARLERGRQYPISVVIADLDDLKKINDRYGHTTGDELLKRTALVLKISFRTEDVVARIGGDEFAILLPKINSEGAENAVRRIKNNLKIQNAAQAGIPLHLSLGTSTVEEGGLLMDAVKQADKNMYRDKKIKP